MEMLVVLALFVAVAALTVPSVQGLLSESRIAAASDTVRGAVAEARARAMEQGVPWRVGFIPNTNVYQLAPEDAQDWNSPDQSTSMTATLVRDQLPKDIIFALNDGDISGPSGASSPGSKWETIAVYLGDGSARDDTTTYFGKSGIVPMRIRLRALTGHVTVETPIMVKENPQ